MTDNDITKAKEHFTYGITHDIFSEPVTSYAKTALWAFEEVNRQKAEIERLEIESASKERAYNDEHLLWKYWKRKAREARAEAIKEVVEMLKAYVGDSLYFEIETDYFKEYLDNLVKVGERE